MECSMCLANERTRHARKVLASKRLCGDLVAGAAASKKGQSCGSVAEENEANVLPEVLERPADMNRSVAHIAR